MAISDLGQRSHRVRLELSGEIDVATAPEEFARVVNARLAPGDVVTLDLRDVDFIDSTGVSMLLRTRDYLDAMGCRLMLIDPSAPVIRVLTLLGLTDQFATESG
jgi:anti-anti-sigma factor